MNNSRRIFLRLGILGITTLLVNKVYGDTFSALIGSITKNSDIMQNNQIIDIRIWPSNIYTRLTIETEHEIRAKYFTLSDPSRLVVDVKDTQLNNVVKTLKSQLVENDPIIDNVKVGQFSKTTVRVVIFLKVPVRVQSQILEPLKFGSVNYKYRYLLDIYHSKAKNLENQNMNDDLLASLQLNSESIDNIKRPTYSSIGVPSKINKKNRKILVMLDPGHGGEDPGAIGPSFLKEKHVVLDIAKRLRELINQTDYIHAEMTRTSDIFIPLDTRVTIARKIQADLFVSIHADAFTSSRPSGSSVFMLSDKGASSSFAKWLANTQNKSDQIGGISFKTQSDSVKKVLLDMSQTWTRRQSSKFGTIIIGNISKIHKMHNTKIEQAGFAVLKAPDIPSILIETAFISNPQDEYLLKTDEFRDKMAQAIFSGINSYAKTII